MSAARRDRLGRGLGALLGDDYLAAPADATEIRTLALTRIVPVEYQVSPALCAHYALHATRLKRAGASIGANDLWIACHALARGCVLVSNNEREFRRIDGLTVENWVAG